MLAPEPLIPMARHNWQSANKPVPSGMPWRAADPMGFAGGLPLRGIRASLRGPGTLGVLTQGDGQETMGDGDSASLERDPNRPADTDRTDEVAKSLWGRIAIVRVPWATPTPPAERSCSVTLLSSARRRLTGEGACIPLLRAHCAGHTPSKPAKAQQRDLDAI